jgi:hypothetical protein
MNGKRFLRMTQLKYYKTILRPEEIGRVTTARRYFLADPGKE